MCTVSTTGAVLHTQHGKAITMPYCSLHLLSTSLNVTCTMYSPNLIFQKEEWKTLRSQKKEKQDLLDLQLSLQTEVNAKKDIQEKLTKMTKEFTETEKYDVYLCVCELVCVCVGVWVCLCHFTVFLDRINAYTYVHVYTYIRMCMFDITVRIFPRIATVLLHCVLLLCFNHVL